MAINRSEVADIVQQAASRMNLSLETEGEIMESLEKEYINDVWQLHHISLDHWKQMGAPIGFLASLEACLQEAGLTKDGSGKGKANKRRSGRISTTSTQSKSSHNSGGENSGKSTTRQKRTSRSTSRDDHLNRSATSLGSGKTFSSSEGRQAALRELKDRLRAESKQGRANTQLDAKGNKVYEWDQNESCVLLYITWPFEFEFGANTKFKCTISKDTLLLKAKHKTGQRSLRYTTGGLVNALHSEWCVVSKGKASSGDGETFAIEVTLFKKNIGLEWKTALIAKHIGTNHMSPDQMREELRTYGVDPGSYKTNDELLKALRMARVGNSSFSALGPSSTRSGMTTRKPPGRSRSADDAAKLFDDDPAGDLKSPGSLASNKKKSRRARSTSADRPLVKETNVNKFSEGQIVYYTSSDGKNKERAKILKIHLDDDLIPFYDIRLTESGKEKQTTDSHLSRLTDELFTDHNNDTSSDRSNRSSGNPQHPAEENNNKSQPPPLRTSVTKSNPTVLPPRFTEHQIVNYTSNGQTEKAKILKVYLDDDLIPFYDIRLEDSGKEKQTTDSHLSSLTTTNDEAAAATQQQGRPSRSTSIEQESSERIKGPPPVRKVPDRSRSMDAGGSLVSPGALKNHRRRVVGGESSSEPKGPRKLPDRSRSMDGPLVSPGALKNNHRRRVVGGESSEPKGPRKLPDRSRSMDGPLVSPGALKNNHRRRVVGGESSEHKSPHVRKLPDRSRSMDAGGALVSPGALKNHRRRVVGGESENKKGPPKVRKLPDRSRSMDAGGALVSPGALKNNHRRGVVGAAAGHHNPSAPSSSEVPHHKSRFMENQVVYYTTNGQKEKAKILKIHLDDDLIPFYDIRLEESGKEKQTTDSHLSSLTDDLFKAAAARHSGSSGSGLPSSSSSGPPERRAPGRSRSMGAPGAATGSLVSPGPLKKGRRGTHHRQPSPQREKSQPHAEPHKSRFMENHVVYYTSNGQKEKAKILKIHLDDDLIPFYDIRLEDSGKEKQTTDSHLSSLTDDLFKAAARHSGSSGSGLPSGPPVRNLPGRSRSMGAPNTATGGSLSPGPLKKGRRGVGRHSQASSNLDIAHIKKELGGYGGMSPATYHYANEDEMIAAWNFIQADSKRTVGRIKRELRDLGQSTEYIEKNELIGALCKARLELRHHDELGGSDRGPSRVKNQRRNSDGPLSSILTPGKQRRNSDGPLSTLTPGGKR